METKRKQDEFNSKAVLIHGDKYDYSKVVYINSSTPVKINCSVHGDFLQRPNNHIQGQGCRACSRTRRSNKERLLLIKEVKVFSISSPHLYSYILSSIISKTDKMQIFCKNHGIFSQEVRKHLQGQICPKCAKCASGKKQAKTTEEFVNEAKSIHRHLYTYDKVNYSNAHNKVKITCKKHGDFLQSPFKHLQGQGCRFCTKAFHNLNWFSDNLDKAYLLGIVYLVKFTSATEVFYKIGITESSIASRFSGKMYSKYNIETIDTLIDTRVNCYQIEQMIHKNNIQLRHYPYIKFVGHSECYKEIINIKDLKCNLQKK